MAKEIDQKEFRNVLGSFVTGITVVTTRTPDGELIGFTANSFTSVSLDPPLILVCLARSSGNLEAFQNSSGFAVNILSVDQREISNTFASKVPDRFAGLDVTTAATGSPILNDCVAWLDCEMYEILDGGDHIIMLGRVVDFEDHEKNPLGYHRSAYVNFGLSKDAAIAAEHADSATAVGALLEHDGKILLFKDENGQLDLPAAQHVGGDDGLLEKLAAIGLEAEIGFLFAVFEDPKRGGTFTCYRGTTHGEIDSDEAAWFDLNDIPFAKIDDAAVSSMVRRYIEDRKIDAFGLFTGDSESDNVGILSD